jgi:hypothetical protein
VVPTIKIEFSGEDFPPSFSEESARKKSSTGTSGAKLSQSPPNNAELNVEGDLPNTFLYSKRGWHDPIVPGKKNCTKSEKINTISTSLSESMLARID